MDIKNGQINVKYGNQNLGESGQLKMDNMKYWVGGSSNIDGQLIANKVDANIGGDSDVNDGGCMQLIGGELNVDKSGNICGDFFGQNVTTSIRNNLNIACGGNMILQGGTLVVVLLVNNCLVQHLEMI